jgi:hypothetical protein
MIDAKTLKIIHTLKFKGNVQPGEYEWASDDKIVAETQMLSYKHWGDTVQFDIIDGIKALVSQGAAPPMDVA